MTKNKQQEMKNKISKLLILGIALEVLVILLAFMESKGDTILFFQASARLSGRVSLMFFLFYGIYATRHPSVETNSIPLSIKTQLTKDFAVIHIIHWVFLAIAVVLSDFELVPFRVAGGALAYGMIVVMPFIYQRKLFASFSLPMMQHVYIFYVWLIFFMTYLSRVRGQTPTATGDMTYYWVLMVVTTSFLVWRIVKMIQDKPSSSPPSV
jgi:hypothetical protein